LTADLSAAAHSPRPAPAPTWRDLWVEAEAAIGSSLEGRRIVERASGYDGAQVLLHVDEPAPARAVPFLRAMVARRAGGEPLQYVLGRWGFRTLDLLVDRRVLIPRPETEVVVEVALGEVRRLAGRAATGPGRPVVLDLGTGSGAIALSMAVELPTAEVWATDASPDALAVARANLAGCGSRAATRVRLIEARWFEGVPDALRGHLDVIVSNPPYISAGEELPPEVAEWEPRQALVAGPSGLEAIADIVAAAPAWLARPGALVLEVAPHQAPAATALARDAGFAGVDVYPDLHGLLRVLVGRV
jgi:release factor glutamine methyltransferase